MEIKLVPTGERQCTWDFHEAISEHGTRHLPTFSTRIVLVQRKARGRWNLGQASWSKQKDPLQSRVNSGYTERMAAVGETEAGHREEWVEVVAGGEKPCRLQEREEAGES